MERRRLVRIIALILLFSGSALLAFPFVSQWIYHRDINQQFVAFQEKYLDHSTHSDDWDELYEKMDAYNKQIYKEGQQELKDPFSYEQPSFDLTEYGLQKNIVAYIEIPRFGNKRFPIYLGASQKNMANGVGHLSQTSLPIGGKNTNCVLAAHRGRIKAGMFRDINKLQVGDLLYVTNFWETMTYRVVKHDIISPHEIDAILIQEGKDMLTLFSCHPLYQNYQRYIVYCERLNESSLK